MDKKQLLEKCKEFTLYDQTSYKEMRAYKANLKSHQDRGSTTDHIKLIAPFGAGYEADFYYFENENTTISEQILMEMGFEKEALEVQKGCKLNWYDNNSVYLSINNIAVLTNVKNANQLFTLIELLK
jgi:hypothetical protein